jgi:toxin ParE1/3/4
MNLIRWAVEARRDLEEIDGYYRPLDGRYVDRLLARIMKAATFLAEFPRAGAVLGGDARKWSITGSDYILIYRTVPDGIDVLRIRNARENWWGE